MTEDSDITLATRTWSGSGGDLDVVLKNIWDQAMAAGRNPDSARDSVAVQTDLAIGSKSE